MELNLDRLALGHSILDLDERLMLGDGQGGEPSQVQVRGSLDVDDMEQRVLVAGGFEVSRAAVCDRCSVEFTQEFPAELQVIILRNPSRGDMPEEEEDRWVVEQSQGVVALDEQLGEAVVLARPLKAICREGCLGLCPVCGIDRNQKTCDCSTEQMDSRWDALKKLREESND